MDRSLTVMLYKEMLKASISDGDAAMVGGEEHQHLVASGQALVVIGCNVWPQALAQTETRY